MLNIKLNVQSRIFSLENSQLFLELISRIFQKESRLLARCCSFFFQEKGEGSKGKKSQDKSKFWKIIDFEQHLVINTFLNKSPLMLGKSFYFEVPKKDFLIVVI